MYNENIKLAAEIGVAMAPFASLPADDEIFCVAFGPKDRIELFASKCDRQGDLIELSDNEAQFCFAESITPEDLAALEAEERALH